VVLIITSKNDIHVNPVADQLINLGVSFFRFNTDYFFTDYKVKWELISNRIFFQIINIYTGLSISSESITTVWERRPETPMVNHPDPQVIKFLVEEYDTFIYNLRYFLTINRFWVGNSIWDRVASSKLLQYKTAIDVGFKVPDTIYTNSKTYFLNFYEKLKCSELALKTISCDSFQKDDLYFTLFTNKISFEDILKVDDDSFDLTINFIQCYIPKKFEIRATCIGDKVISYKIDTSNQSKYEGEIDWRAGYEKGIKYSKYEMPKVVNKMCVDYLKLLNLNFGCFDFIYTEDKQIIFLECNPNGQWMWLEQELDLGISYYIAKLLANPKLVMN
jgi:hypothetical protein